MTNTHSYNKIQTALNNINSELSGVNFKLVVKARKTSSNWYEYTILCVQIDEYGNNVTNRLFSGRPEAVLGFIDGFNKAIQIFAK